ncbi:hypothetical protein ACFLZX_01650 [Nanoarchaeota archaeon]
MKKGQGGTFWYVIAGILAITILVVVILVVGRHLGLFSETTKCENRGGKCLAQVPNYKTTGSCEEGYVKIFSAECIKVVKEEGSTTYIEDPKGKKNGQCCIPLG